jgi:serine/threonine protein kinase
MAETTTTKKFTDSKWFSWKFLPLVIVVLAFLGNSGPEVVVPVTGLVAITSWIFIPLWLRHKRNLAKDALEVQKKNPEQDVEMKRMRERLENLEAMLCNLDREINLQLEKSLSSGRLVTMDPSGGVSQMPTTFLNVASALEGRYQILKELGRGGMGIVFHAHDKELKEQVAIKILSPLLSNDPEALERLKREVSAARRITHPYVIRIHDIAEVNGLHYVSMEFFYGTNLKEFVKRSGTLSMMQAYEIAAQICEGLDAAHRQGVIHRDLKSQNIIINPSNQIKIIDFGLAHTAHLQGMTATGLIMGTPEYMAPEQVSGKKVDERADIYSLGIILYELFTGRVPFSGDSAIAVGFKQLKEDPPPPRDINPQLLPEVEAILLKALQKDPANRYGSVTALRTALQEAVFSQAPSSELQKQAALREMDRVKH